jgi:hypothetical protein
MERSVTNNKVHIQWYKNSNSFYAKVHLYAVLGVSLVYFLSTKTILFIYLFFGEEVGLTKSITS